MSNTTNTEGDAALAGSDRAGDEVHVHKPKAAHSWREFLIEIGTIICGILIALGLEQTIEAVHANSEVQEAREALREELTANASILLFGTEEDKCLLQQVVDYAAWAHGGPKPQTLRTALPEYGESTWASVKTSAVPHMPLHERRALASIYDALAHEQGVVDIQRSSSLVLVGAAERDTLDREDVHRVLDAIATERLLTQFHADIAKSLLGKIEDLGVKAPALTAEDQAGIRALCGRGGS